ncbi:hypothetical protein Plav_3007 [Parvibaculum lavamentivorans DS-1]|uniref:Uncharacterized protein n=1 Tax=Parvibaculum lavamentivorans (strain DS-1 / DSM 13023 / NCIMB 13966) TaxID=402881 RepID=A7HXI1_PARL1|nr:hypothetical protein [Parvibaculum lavamentivorans]ABS64614.1 hypothetical protein Plav_3007 [Parvibaculum lavamentivorans DS-1]
MQGYLFVLDPIALIAIVAVLVILLPVLLWLGITVLWITLGLLGGAFSYFFLLYLFGIPALAIIGGITVALMIWGALLRG